MQQATQAAQALQQQIDNESLKYQAQLQITQAELASRERIAELNARKELLLEQVRLETDKGKAILDAQIKELERHDEHQHETQIQAMKQGHEHKQAVLDRHAEGVRVLLKDAAVPMPTPPEPIEVGPIDLGTE